MMMMNVLIDICSWYEWIIARCEDLVWTALLSLRETWSCSQRLNSTFNPGVRSGQCPFTIKIYTLSLCAIIFVNDTWITSL